VATLLAYLHEPAAFVAVADLERALTRRKKGELVELVLRAVALYPDLARLLDLGTTPDASADAITATLAARDGDFWERVERGAALAESLLAQGRLTAARRGFYALLSAGFAAIEDQQAESPTAFAQLERLAAGYTAAVARDPARDRQSAAIEQELTELESDPIAERAELSFDAVWEQLQ
jgi:hypothetical protein